MSEIICERCGKTAQAQRLTKRFCSKLCAHRAWHGIPLSRACRCCGKAIEVVTQGDANRQYCSTLCARRQNRINIKAWCEANPGAVAKYRGARVAKNPGLWVEKARAERVEILELLGGACVVCGVDNPSWLHADYIPTCRGKPMRHQRHVAFVRAHLADFRLLCANHHYELTLTGRIEGTDITQ